MDGLFSSGSERTRFLLFSLLGIFLGLVIIGVFWEGLNSCNPAILKRKGKFNPCGNIWIPFVLVLPTTKVVIFQGAGQRIWRRAGGGGKEMRAFQGEGREGPVVHIKGRSLAFNRTKWRIR